MISISPRDLTFADVHTSLGHEAHPSLGLLTAEGVEVVDVWRLLCDLKVTDTAVPLHTHRHTHTNIENSHIKHVKNNHDIVIIRAGNIKDLHTQA